MNREELVSSLKGLSDQDMQEFSSAELDSMNAILSESKPSIASTSVPSEKAQLLNTVNPLGAIPFVDLPIEDQFEDKNQLPINTEGLGRVGGSMIGGIAGANKAAKLLQATPPVVKGVGTVIGGGLGAFTGGFSGDIAQSGVQGELNTDQGLNSFKKALAAGGREAAFDVIGNSLFIGGGAALKGLRPKASALAGSIRKILEEGGSNASLGQLTDNTLWEGMEQLTRGALVGSGKFGALDIAQKDAIVKYTDNYAESIAGVASSELTDSATGRLIVDVLNNGSAAHSSAAKPLYEEVDRLAGGLTVNLKGIKETAQKVIDDFAEIADIGLSDAGGETLKKIINLEDNRSFSAANKLRSELLQESRALQSKEGNEKVAMKINELVDQVTVSIERAEGGVKGQSGAALDALRKANRFWKFGKDNLNNKIVRQMIKRDDLISKIAPSLFANNKRDEILALRRAIKSISVIDKSVNFTETWAKIQGGYIETMIPHAADDVMTAPIRKLHREPKMRKTLTAIFPKGQRENMLNLSKSIDELLSKTQSAPGLLQLRQAGAMTQAIGGMAALGTGGGVSGLEVAGLIGAPMLFATIATNKRMTNQWIRWAAAKPGTVGKFTALAKLSQLLGVQEKNIDPKNASGKPQELVDANNLVEANLGVTKPN